MKGLKKALSIIICVAMVTTMFACGVAAEETSTEEVAVAEETSEVLSEVAEEETYEIPEVPEELETIHIADSEELPDYFYVVPKEKILELEESSYEDSLKGLYAYIAIEIKERYLDPNNISLDKLDYENGDLLQLQTYYRLAIEQDQFSYSIEDSYDLYSRESLKEPEIAECIMRAIFTYSYTLGIDAELFTSLSTPIYEVMQLSPEKITFSEEQLNYFN